MVGDFNINNKLMNHPLISSFEANYSVSALINRADVHDRSITWSIMCEYAVTQK